MELGSLVCTPARPACLMCPVHTFCRAFAESRQESLPVKKKKAETPIVRGVAVIVRRGPDVLLMQRPARGVWAEMWEFPVAVALKNLTSGIEKFLGLKVRSAKRRGQVRHQLTHRTFEYDVVTCEATCDRMPQLPECLAGGEGTCYTAARWVAWPQIAYKELPLARVAHKIAACAG
jgi:A/G-specific adenine glycosylase